jgi:hypothetical protein
MDGIHTLLFTESQRRCEPFCPQSLPLPAGLAPALTPISHATVAGESETAKQNSSKHLYSSLRRNHGTSQENIRPTLVPGVIARPLVTFFTL